MLKFYGGELELGGKEFGPHDSLRFVKSDVTIDWHFLTDSDKYAIDVHDLCRLHSAATELVIISACI